MLCHMFIQFVTCKVTKSNTHHIPKTAIISALIREIGTGDNQINTLGME